MRVLHRLGRKVLQFRFLLGCGWGIYAGVVGFAELGRQLAIVLTWVLACARGDLGSQQVHNHAVFVGSPYGAVRSQEACSRAFLAAKTVPPIKEPRREPFE